MSLIRVKDLSFAYEEGSPVLKGISLDFDNRTTAIIGQNGAGKTTFVKLLKGLLKPKDGDIFIHDLNVKDTTAASLSRYIGLVFQNPNEQIFKSNVLDEVMFGPLNIGQDEKTARKNALNALDMVGLIHTSDDNPQDLGLSEKKLVCIAAVLAMDVDIVIFDEPTIAQDYTGKERIKQIIRALRDEGKLVMTIIHDMDFVAECFERTVVLNQGEVIMDGPTRHVFSHGELLKRAHLEQPAVTQLANRLGYKHTVLTVDELVTHIKN